MRPPAPSLKIAACADPDAVSGDKVTFSSRSSPGVKASVGPKPNRSIPLR
jgi:hypothetical protein